MKNYDISDTEQFLFFIDILESAPCELFIRKDKISDPLFGYELVPPFVIQDIELVQKRNGSPRHIKSIKGIQRLFVSSGKEIGS